jgi:hypothetical protein
MWSTTSHPEVPLDSLFGLVHFGIARVDLVLGRTGRGDDGRVHDGASALQGVIVLSTQFDTVRAKD